MEKKGIEKKAYFNREVIERLKDKYGVSQRFITMSLNGDRTSETSESIKKDYRVMVREQKRLLKAL